MKLLACAQALSKLRDGRVWMLLASNDAVTTLALFHDLFMTSLEDRVLPQSILLERLGFAMDELRAQGHELPQPPQTYLNYWRTKGWLSRSLQAGAAEEEYSLTAEAATAVRLMLNQLQPRSFATESRLASVIHQVVRLDEDTDTNPATRLAALQAERDRIEREIALLSQGEVRTLSDDRALERARELIQQAHELADDFQNVRSSFERLNQDLRASLLEAEGSRFDALRSVFDGLDRIKKSDPGRTFDAFWRLLRDVEQSSALEESIENLLSRRFTHLLSADERHFLGRLTQRLMVEATGVQDVIRLLGHSLNRFVRNGTPETRKRINDVLQQAKLSALSLKDVVEPRAVVPFDLTQSVPQVRSVAQYQLRDPQLTAAAAPIAQAKASTLSLEVIQGLIGQSEIDLKTLRQNILAALVHNEKVSIQELLLGFPAPQGLGTVMGYITLGTKYGVVSTDSQIVSWLGRDEVTRKAELPVIHFSRDNVSALHV